MGVGMNAGIRSAGIGAVAVAALVTGCGSKVAGSGASGSPPVLHLASSAQGEATAADAVAPATSGGKVAADYGAGAYVLKADLPATPDGAKVYRTDAVTQAEVQKLATAFGITDPVTKAKAGFKAGRLGVATDGSWLYGADCDPSGFAEYCPADGSTGVGSVASPPDATTTNIGSGSSGSSGTGCASAGKVVGPGATSGGAADVPPAVDCPQGSGGGSGGTSGYDPGTAPSAASKPSSVPGSGPVVDPGTATTSTAPTPPDKPVGTPEPTYTPPPVATDDVTRKAAAPIVSALGLTTEHVGYGQAIADPTVDGLRVVGATTNISVAADGTIDYASGRLLPVSAGATYPLISAKDAFAQLPPRPVPAIACAALPGTPTPCPTFPPPVVTDVALGLSVTADEKGELLVPAWLFTIKDDVEPTAVIAVEPKYIGTPPTPSAGTIEPASAVPPVSAGSAAPNMPASYPAGNASGAPGDVAPVPAIAPSSASPS